MTNLLKNGGFEDGAWHKTHTGEEVGEVSAPKHWIAFWKDGEPNERSGDVNCRRPECKVIRKEPPYLDPLRIHSGNQAWQCFTFFGVHDAGIYQRVEGLTPGNRVRATAWTHAWSSNNDNPHKSQTDGGGQWNFEQFVGIDSHGGTDPWSDSVVWSEPRNIYDVYKQLPPIEAVVGSAGAVTVFLRSTVQYPFKHADVYWDDAVLTIVGAPEEPEEPETPIPPGTEVSLTVTPQEPLVKEIFDVVASEAAQLGRLHLVFTGGEVLRSEPHLAPPDVTWRAVALETGEYTVKVLAGKTVLGEAHFIVRTAGPTIS
ncbi:MAG: hypothetical protein ACP5HM_08115 [Anaerolineae bacterium]